MVAEARANKKRFIIAAARRGPRQRFGESAQGCYVNFEYGRSSRSLSGARLVTWQQLARPDVSRPSGLFKLPAEAGGIKRSANNNNMANNNIDDSSAGDHDDNLAARGSSEFEPT